MLNFDSLWVEKYRPKTLDDFICNEKIKLFIETIVTQKNIPNLLFVGTPGIGKTSLAKIIVNDILKSQYLYINASDENGIDTIRSKVTSFAQSKSLYGDIKVIILDETDGLSIDAQRALRNTMEEYSSITRFILTANYKYRIINALQSRCQSFDLTPPIEGVVKRCIHILKSEKVDIPAEQKQQLLVFIKANYPDLRKTINELQKYSINRALNLDISDSDKTLQLLFSEIKNKNVTTLRKVLIENELSFNNDYVSLMKGFFNYVDKHEADINLRKDFLLTISEYLYRSSFVVDQEINCYTCLIALSELNQRLGK